MRQRCRRQQGRSPAAGRVFIYSIIGHYSVMEGIRSIHQPGHVIRHNARVKIYPDGTRDIMICSRPIFREKGWEDCKPSLSSGAKKASRDGVSVRAQRRAKAAVREIALCNRFSYFVTLTLNKERVDRYDMAAITKRLNSWLDNCVRRKGLAYVLVPERHKDGAIHFHGFFNEALRAEPSGHVDKQGHEIFNLPEWPLGFSTAIRLYGEYHKAVAYVQKYIGKQGEKPGGRWYYSGGALARPEVLLCELDEQSAPEDAYSFSVDEAGLWITMWTEGPGTLIPGEDLGELTFLGK